MPLDPGARLGSYEVVGWLGAGGMGEVYRARDTKLGREVALKILSDQFAHDADRLARFRREAQLLASLGHPNIAAIHGLEETNGAVALVLELVEGETLQERLEAGRALPLEDALPIARQMVEALEAAHERGIVHRDLKPANVKIRPDGTVKVLDFGLAKAIDTRASGADMSLSPTLTSPAAMTGIGVILGTAAYMSPEQARGRSVDKRSDVWAFGCVLFEMLTGVRAFAGEDVTDTIAAIVRGEPDWQALPPATPASIRRLLRRCLRKDLKDRLPDIGSARLDIDEALVEPLETSASALRPANERKSGRFTWLPWSVAAGAIVVALGLTAVAYLRRAPADTRSYRASILPPEQVTLATVSPATRFSLSPDGRRLAFLAMGPDRVTRLWVRNLDSLVAQPLSGTDGAVVAFWSPDSRFLAFGAGGKLKKIDASGGVPLTLADMSANNGGTWNRDDVIVFAPSPLSPLYRVSASGGGTTTAVTTFDAAAGDARHWQPFFLPDGRHFLYHVLGSKNGGANEARAVSVGSLDPAEKGRVLLQGGSNAQYALGYLLFLRNTTLMAQRFDADRLELGGEAVPVAEQIQVGGTSGRTGAFSVSQTGVLVYQTGASLVGSRLVWHDRSGKELGTLGDPADYGDIELSPDGRQLAVSIIDSTSNARDIWIYDVASGLRTRLTFDTSADDVTPVWSPDGSQVMFGSSRSSGMRLYRKASSGVGDEEAISAEGDRRSFSWSRDGHVLYQSSQGAPQTDLWAMPLTGDRTPFPFLRTPFIKIRARFSPDGRWVTYESSESGRFQVYVAPFPKADGKWQISTSGGTSARWRRDGKEIFFLTPDNKVMVADVDGQSAAFKVGAVRPLFEARARTDQRYGYDVSADGQRVLVNTAAAEASADLFTIVINWTAALRRP